jgi:hypothetical protein
MGSGEAKVESCILQNTTRLAVYFISHLSLNPDISRNNVSEETLID